ncbi:MAG: adenosylmethionine--8-amino-7-oxononanoate transaminase [Polyangiaceae bacterium]|nr:adenosylmethionine--8-amino-7-oxononanoate transaminase [Polyangiaceae bacterium]
MSADRRASIVAADKKYVWHPYTPMDRYIDVTDPLVVDRAEGCLLFDVDGRSYIDAMSSWWVATLGHNHPRLVRALTEQAQRLCHSSLAGATHEAAARLAEELVSVAPQGLSRVFYSDDGSTAVESAVKMAAQFWFNEGRFSKKKFVALDGAFHGETIGAASLGGIEVFRRPYAGVLFDCLRAPEPSEADAYTSVFNAIERMIVERADEIAAVVLEPLVQGAVGMRMYPAHHLKRMRELCTHHNVLLIVDEVFTGYGRTGTMWACDQAGICPDILCVAKGFSGGMLPMAATLVTEQVFDAFRGAPDRAFFYGHSYCGNPLGSAVAREVLAVFRDEQIVEGVRAKALMIQKAFDDLALMPGVRSVRSLGMIGALDLAESASYLGQTGWRVYDEARKRGAYLRPLGDVVYVAPPLNIPDVQLDRLLAIVKESVSAAVGGP